MAGRTPMGDRFPEAGPPCRTIRDAYVAASGNPTHFVGVTATIDAGIATAFALSAARRPLINTVRAISNKPYF